MDGLLIVDKPEGLTSADVVRLAKRKLQCRTGHLGTLDPFASGVLPLCLGEGTKIAQFLNTADKTYVGRIRLGVATDTGDRTGTVSQTAPVPSLTAAILRDTASRFLGELQQVPPMHSALKRQGTPLYKLARQGIVVDREARPIHVEQLTLEEAGPDSLAFSVSCSKGTYVRVLAQDIAATLGTVGHVASLRRTRFGRFSEEAAIAIDDIGKPEMEPLGLCEALADVSSVCLDPAASEKARQGYAPLLSRLALGERSEKAKLVDPAGSLLAVVVRRADGRWSYARVFRSLGSRRDG
jgi:tRNA pseudouridine55 synthase